MFNFLKEKLKNFTDKFKTEPTAKKTKAKKEKAKIKSTKSLTQEEDTSKKPVGVLDKEKPAKLPKSLLEKQNLQNLGNSILKETDKELTKDLYEHASSSPEQELSKKMSGKLRDEDLRLIEKGETLQQIEEQEEKPKTSFFDRFKTKLDEEKFDEIFQELEMILLQNNVALEVVDEIKKSLKEQLVGKILKEVDIMKSLKIAIEKVLLEPKDFVKEIKTSLAVKQPFVITFVGINGSGKTTTIAKVANMLKKNKLSVVLAAADTFRAAAIQQLEEHAARLNLPIVKKDYGSDPASVGFDAIAYAKKHHIDVVLIDTAGRMNTKDSLMKEMEKIMKVCKPDMKIFIGESITGNDATQQAKDFNNSIDLSGIILSKADVDEKAGTILSVSYVTKKPILFLGTGQSYADLEVFNKKRVLDGLGL